VPARRETKKRRLLEYLAERKPAIIGEAEWREILSLLAPVTESYLRKLLAATAVPVAQPFAGVRQSSFDELERSLRDLEQAYTKAVQLSDREQARLIRRVVIRSKDHAKLAAQNPRLSAQKRAEKKEMADWMLVWLENPGVFPLWVELRKKARGEPAPGPEEPTRSRPN
jgi:hypothetical protein